MHTNARVCIFLAILTHFLRVGQSDTIISHSASIVVSVTVLVKQSSAKYLSLAQIIGNMHKKEKRFQGNRSYTEYAWRWRRNVRQRQATSVRISDK